MGRERARSNLRSWLWVVLGAASIAAGARVTVAMEPVPMTLQTLAVLIVGGLIGGRRGAWAATLYLGAILAGAPLLSDGAAAGGTDFLSLKSGGYVVAFIPAAFLSGFAGGGVLASLTVMAAAHALILLIGAAWLAAHIGWRGALDHGVTPFLFGALVKTIVAAACVEHFASRKRR